MAEKKKNIHAGHRERTKERFLAGGIKDWYDHQILELLLFYAIPQRDVNDLAHDLIDHFGSLAGVLDAFPDELMRIKGVGLNAAVLLKLIPAVTGRYLDGRTAPGVIIHTTMEAKHALAPYFYGARNEMVYVLCLDSKEKMLGVRKISEGNNTNSDVTIRRVAEACLGLGASFCYLAHNHVSNIALPSLADLNTTYVVREALELVGVQLLDHLVFSDGDLVSIRESEESEQSGKLKSYQLVRPGQQ